DRPVPVNPKRSPTAAAVKRGLVATSETGTGELVSMVTVPRSPKAGSSPAVSAPAASPPMATTPATSSIDRSALKRRFGRDTTDSTEHSFQQRLSRRSARAGVPGGTSVALRGEGKIWL